MNSSQPRMPPEEHPSPDQQRAIEKSVHRAVEFVRVRLDALRNHPHGEIDTILGQLVTTSVPPVPGTGTPEAEGQRLRNEFPTTYEQCLQSTIHALEPDPKARRQICALFECPPPQMQPLDEPAERVGAMDLHLIRQLTQKAVRWGVAHLRPKKPTWVPTPRQREPRKTSPYLNDFHTHPVSPTDKYLPKSQEMRALFPKTYERLFREAMDNYTPKIDCDTLNKLLVLFGYPPETPEKGTIES